jgi:hypothetical protein
MYYSIHPSLWGYAKYQAEYAVPFAITGLMFLMLKLTAFPYSRNVLTVLVSILIFLNIAGFVRMPQRDLRMDASREMISNPPGDPASGGHILAAIPYSYREAYDAVKKENLAENSYSIGATYGILPEIMNGYSVKSIRAVHDIFIKQEANRLNAPNDGWSVDLVESDNRIKVVLIGAVSGKKKLIDQFRARGWSEMGEYKNLQYGTSVVVMKKPVAQLSSPATLLP